MIETSASITPATTEDIGFFSISNYLFKSNCPFAKIPITLPLSSCRKNGLLEDLLLLFSGVKNSIAALGE